MQQLGNGKQPQFKGNAHSATALRRASSVHPETSTVVCASPHDACTTPMICAMSTPLSKRQPPRLRKRRLPATRSSARSTSALAGQHSTALRQDRLRGSRLHSTSARRTSAHIPGKCTGAATRRALHREASRTAPCPDGLFHIDDCKSELKGHGSCQGRVACWALTQGSRSRHGCVLALSESYFPCSASSLLPVCARLLFFTASESRQRCTFCEKNCSSCVRALVRAC